MVKQIIACAVWAKPDAVQWLLEGIAEHVAPDVEVWFQFDWQSEECQDNLNRLAPSMLSHRVQSWHSDVELREVGAHNRLLQRFLDSDADAITIWQDDQRMTGPITAHVERAINAYGEKIGIIGGRDGYDAHEQNRISAKWSETRQHHVLRPGEFFIKPYLNSGPIIYPKATVRKVGPLDESFVAMNVWVDYGWRCMQAGLTNLVMGTSCIHQKIGRCTATRWYTDADSIHDANLIKEKVPTWR
jgi:hypothetical protein